VDTEQEGTLATPDEKIDGIVAQTRGDVGQGNVSDVAEALRQRLEDAGIQVNEGEFEGILARVSATD
jgi:hypothetical protein